MTDTEQNAAAQTRSTDSLPASYVAQPPRRIPVFSREGVQTLWSYVKLLGVIVVQPLLPFRTGPDIPLDPPAPSTALDDKQLAQCVKIAEREEGARKYLEEKARSTFGMTSFVAPLLFALLIFLLGRSGSTAWNIWGFIFAGIALLLLILSFLSVLRAQAVQERQELFVESVIDKDRRDFRKYDAGFYARGLLWCASVNTAMNAHIAQFVRGAQILTGLTAIATVLAAIPAAFLFAIPSPAITKTEVVGTVAIASSEAAQLRSQLAQVAADVKILSERQGYQQELTQLRVRLEDLEQRMIRQQADSIKPKPTVK